MKKGFIYFLAAIMLAFFVNAEALVQTNTLTNVTLITAFLGGIFMLLAPCSFSVLPAYFAYSVKSKNKTLLNTFFFVLGFAFMFALFGLGVGYIGYYLNLYKYSISFYSGIALIIIGILTFFGFSFPTSHKTRNFKGLSGNFLFGNVYAVGYAGCAGPMLIGILLLAASQNAFYSTLTMFSYAIGFGIPLIILSYFFDRFNVFNSKIMEKSIIKLKRFHVTIPNLISSILFITIGAVLVKYQTFGYLNYANNKLTDISYSLQTALLNYNIPFGNISFLAVLAILVFAVYKLNQ